MFTMLLDHSDSIDSIVNEHSGHLLRLCFVYLKDEGLAEDAVQDTFIKAYRGLGAFRGQSSRKTWLTRIAINTCKDYMKKRDYTDRPLSLNDLRDLPEDREAAALIAAVADLPPIYKDVVLLHYYEGFTSAEIAKMLHASDATIRTRLKRARELLYVMLI